MRKIRPLRGREERRQKREQKLIWVTEPYGLTGLADVLQRERRAETDTLRALHLLAIEVQRCRVDGLVAAVMRRDGRIDLVASGLAYDNPIIASGSASRLVAMLDSWAGDPGDLLPIVD